MSLLRYTCGMSIQQHEFGESLRKARKARGLRQEDIAEELGVNPKQVGRWEKGENAPRGPTLARLVQYLRSRANAPDLSLFDAIVEEEVKRAVSEPEDQRAKALIIIDKLAHDPFRFERWLIYGQGLVDAIDSD